MIIENGKYYLYRHIRLDKNEPFYIGVGTKCKQDILYSTYKRSYSKSGRKDLWKNIVSKTDYEIEILLESDDYEFILEKEKEFIKLYGRKNLKLGSLANLTDGGEGVLNRVISEETKGKISKANKGRILSPERRLICGLARKSKTLTEAHKSIISLANLKRNHRGKNNVNSVEVYQYDLSGVFIKKWDSMKDIQRELGIPNARISDVTSGRKYYKNTGYWFRQDMGQFINILDYPNIKGKRNDLS